MLVSMHDQMTVVEIENRLGRTHASVSLKLETLSNTGKIQSRKRQFCADYRKAEWSIIASLMIIPGLANGLNKKRCW